VGHSLGGFTAPLVAQPHGAAVVFLCTAPVIGGGVADELRARMVTERTARLRAFVDEHGSRADEPTRRWHGFYHDCDDATAAWASAVSAAVRERR
jgi:hypothetical protein